MANNGISVETQTAAESEEKQNYFQKFWLYRKYLVLEICLLFYAIPSTLNNVAVSNFPFEKACRVNLGYSIAICENILYKSELGIDCKGLTFENTTMGPTPDLLDLMGFNYTLCKAESEAQKLTVDVYGKRAPIAAFFILIVLLFAGGWCDRYNKRKPFMLLPVMGEGIYFGCLLISAIFHDSIPMEFGAYLEGVVPALFGGLTLFSMALNSYMTIATSEKDRVFRFGIYAMFSTSIVLIGTPASGFLFKHLGYIGSFIMAICFEVAAILYIMFFLKEVKPSPKVQEEDTPPPLSTHGPSQLRGAENLAYETTNVDENKVTNFEMSESLKPENVMPLERRGLLREFFDPTLVRDIIKFPLIKRPNNGRLLLLLLIIAYFLTTGSVSGEYSLWFGYAVKKFKWDGIDNSFYEFFSSAATIVGTFIGTVILSEFSNSTIGILSAISIVNSRLLFAFAEDTTTVYIGGITEMFIALGAIAINAIGSSIVNNEEISKMYTIFSICQPIGQFIFPIMFSQIYQATVDTFPGAIFLYGEIFHVSYLLLFIFFYFVLRRNENKSKQTDEKDDQNDNAAKTYTSPECEIY